MKSDIGCGSNIEFGPAFDADGSQIVSGPILHDGSIIVLYFNEGYRNGNCDNQTGETATKMVLSKI